MLDNLFTLDNLFDAWCEFKVGKQNKPDVMNFEFNLENNIFTLHEELITKKYIHQPYYTFKIWDPKFRIINKAEVRDRVVHHLLFRYLEKSFQPSFICHSYSCQIGKGTHKAVADVNMALRKISKNYTTSVWSLKLDIKKFFASVDHATLLNLLRRKVSDRDVLWLLGKVVNSYHTPGAFGTGMPIGNLTSQIFANIYLSELDYFVKFVLREKYYFRYADDFLFLNTDKNHLKKLEKLVGDFVFEKLKLIIHPDKIIYRKFNQGVDFIGYVLLPHHTILRTKTKRRMFKKVEQKFRQYHAEKIDTECFNQTVQSYLGMLKHCNGFGLRAALTFWVF